MDFYKISAKNLRAELERTGLTVSELSKKSGVSMSSISQYLSGRCAPTVPNASKLATVLGCHPLVLMGLGFSLPNEEIDDPIIFEVTNEMRTMSYKQKEHLLKYIRLMKDE